MLEQLVDLQQHALEYARCDGLIAADEFFYAEQNAKVVQASAEYYRTMFSGRVSFWNLRDQHMAGTLDVLAGHLSRQRGRPAKIVVWAHNSHVGDARATWPGYVSIMVWLGRGRQPGWGGRWCSVARAAHGPTWTG